MIASGARVPGALAASALARLGQGACTSDDLCAEVLGLGRPGPVIADRVVAALLEADPRACRLPDGRWALAAPGPAASHLDHCPFAVVDVETTGGSATDDRITEIAVVLVHGQRREVVFESLVNPGRPISPWASSITGITDAMVATAPPFGAIADALAAVLAGRVFTAHNARFDWGFVDAAFQRATGARLEGPRLCTVRLARRLVPGLPSAGLDQCIVHFGLENAARHRAAGDAYCTALLLERLLGLARGAGVGSLPELLALQGGAAARSA